VKLQQLRFLVEVVRSGLNVSLAAENLHTSQPGVSKQIRLLEEELGLDIFVRNGKRVVGMTDGGRHIIEAAERVLHEAANLRQAAREAAHPDTGTFTIATTHTQARYRLPEVITHFREKYAQVALVLHQGNPIQVAEEVAAGRADIAIATEALDRFPDLVMLPCYQWNRVLVAPEGHPVLSLRQLTLEDLSAYPLLSYDSAFTGQGRMLETFQKRGLEVNMALTALDADVIKTYVGLGLGVGIIAEMAFDEQRDLGLRARDVSHLFPASTTRIGVRRGAYLRQYIYDFIEAFAPHLSRHTVDLALKGEGQDPGL
jgi:LysR family cys regulon transcriptional activator